MTDSLAAFRGKTSSELSSLAEEQLKHDLQQSDRDILKSAASKLTTHAKIGSVVGIGLGMFLAFRIRSGRRNMLSMLRATERPTAVQFAGGRTEPLPDLTPLLKPTLLGDIAMYSLFSAGGLFLGGETGLMTGYYFASKSISQDPAAKARIETAFRKFRADVLRRQADELDGGKDTTSLGGLF